MGAGEERAAVARARISAPLGACWRALADPRSLERWQAERVEGELEPGAELTLRWDSLGQSIDLDVLEVEEPYRLRFRGYPGGAPAQEQVITLAGASPTEIEIAHRGFRPGPGGEDERAGTEAGWRSALSLLELYLTRYAGQPRAAGAALGTAQRAPDPTYAALCELFGLGSAPNEGEELAISLGGPPRRARVLIAAPPRHVTLSIPELSAALSLRTFPAGAAAAPEASVAAAQYWRWSPRDPSVGDLRPAVETGLERAVGALGGSPPEA